MATRSRRRRKHKKSKLVLLWFPILLLIAILVWLFREEAARLSGWTLTQRTAQKSSPERITPKKTPKTFADEKILDPERKKLDEILKNR